VNQTGTSFEWTSKAKRQTDKVLLYKCSARANATVILGNSNHTQTWNEIAYDLKNDTKTKKKPSQATYLSKPTDSESDSTGARDANLG
jgi:hypothetical protein